VGFVELVGAFGGADYVVAALDYHCGDVLDAGHVLEELVVFLEEAAIDEVVAFDSGEGFGEGLVAGALDELRVGDQPARAAFPHAPCAGGLDAFGSVTAR
jgi:hypothetical protein